jgi:hypothetical protein
MRARRTVVAFLAVHTLLSWLAVLLRIDHFPLSWAPMYSVYTPKESVTYAVVEKGKRKLKTHGWQVRRRDGGTEWVPMNRLNIPMRSMWRLYYERTFGKGPPKYKHKNHAGATFDRWMWELKAGEPFIRVNWERRLLTTLNKTLERMPSDPSFILSAYATRSVMHFDRQRLALVSRSTEERTLEWDERWNSDFGG